MPGGERPLSREFSDNGSTPAYSCMNNVLSDSTLSRATDWEKKRVTVSRGGNSNNNLVNSSYRQFERLFGRENQKQMKTTLERER